MNYVCKNRDTVSGVCFLLLSLYLLYEVQTFAIATEKIRSLGPEFFPDILATSMGLLSCALIVQGLCKPKAPLFFQKISLHSLMQPLAFILGPISFMFLADSLGFIVWSILFLIIMQCIMGEKRYQLTLLLACSISLFMYLVFATCLNVPLPHGILSF